LHPILCATIVPGYPLAPVPRIILCHPLADKKPVLVSGGSHEHLFQDIGITTLSGPFLGAYSFGTWPGIHRGTGLVAWSAYQEPEKEILPRPFLNSSQRKSLCQKARTVGLSREDAVSLADELEIWVELALKVESSLHDMIKKWEKKCPV
jgi:hypothetical protein